MRKTTKSVKMDASVKPDPDDASATDVTPIKPKENGEDGQSAPATEEKKGEGDEPASILKKSKKEKVSTLS
jgi:hypothetical protein